MDIDTMIATLSRCVEDLRSLSEAKDPSALLMQMSEDARCTMKRQRERIDELERQVRRRVP
jgi:polyhydroxyalkanoate synthesis regulator phasin